MTTLADIQRHVGVAADGKWGPATAGAVAKALGMTVAGRALSDPGAFYGTIRKSLFGGSITPSELAGIEAKLKAFGAAEWPVGYASYAMATSYWETAKTMQPVREAFHLSEEWRRKNLRYYPWYGRGDVQTTWEANYIKADEALGLNGTLIANLDRMLEPEISAQTMVRGMTEGWFAGDKAGRHTLARHLPGSGAATDAEFQAARRIINGVDKRAEIARIAGVFQTAFEAGGWA